MRFLACVKKDMRLICGGGSRFLLYLLLPIILVILMVFCMGDIASSRKYVDPFRIAIRDNDDTMISAILITQLREIGLFSEVKLIKDGISDEFLFDAGYAAVLTIPHDFFYDLYDMMDTAVILVLNENMPNESTLVHTCVSSVLTIVSENQRVWYASARVRYGDLTDEQMREVYRNYSTSALSGVLSRLSYFDTEKLYSEKEYNAKLFFLAGIISMICMFIPLCVLKTLPDEVEMGILSRYMASGRSLSSLLLSKLSAAFLLSFVPVTTVSVLLDTVSFLSVILVFTSVFLASFALFLFTSSVLKSAPQSQLLGNVLLLLMLSMGGALYPYELFPAHIQIFSRFTIPYYSLQGIYVAARCSSISDLLQTILPLLISSAVFTAASLPFLGKKGKRS